MGVDVSTAERLKACRTGCWKEVDQCARGASSTDMEEGHLVK